MNYIDQNILPDEQILYRTKKHYIVFLQPVLWTCGALIFLLSGNPYIIKSGMVFGVIALCSWIFAYLNYSVSEFAVTNKRIIMCEGFFFKHTNETRINTIANLNIDQNLLAQILDYGTIIVKTYGGNDDPFMDIPKPMAFKRQLELQLDKIGNGNGPRG